MKRLTIADINIDINGIDNCIFNDRVSEYIAGTDFEMPNISIDYVTADFISIPEGDVKANVHQRLWMKNNDAGYMFVDLCRDEKYSPTGVNYLINGVPLPDIESHFTLVKSDKNWKNISAELIDIEQFTNVPINIRSFNLIGEIFRYAVLMHRGVIVHSSAIDYMNNGIIFSAPSGTGKSTHAGLWRQYYPETVAINDDSPAVRVIDGKIYVYGTPWSGKTNLNHNHKAPLKAIVFLEQAPNNSMVRLSPIEAVKRLINEVRQPVFEEIMHLLLKQIDDIIKNVPAYLLKCNISKEAVDLAKNTILSDLEE